MAEIEESPPVRKQRHELGQDLSGLSVDELKGRVDDLRTEIGRIEAELAAKGATRNAAEALFSRR